MIPSDLNLKFYIDFLSENESVEQINRYLEVYDDMGSLWLGEMSSIR